MKRFFVLFSVMIVGLIACTNENQKDEAIDKDDVKAFIKEYKGVQYTIDAKEIPDDSELAERFKGYLSEDVYKKLRANRFYGRILPVVEKTGKNVGLETVYLEKTGEDEDGAEKYAYTLEIKFYDEKNTDYVKRKGQLTIARKGGEFIITRDWEAEARYEGVPF
ncbi:hypothetical protein [Pseudalkalibacillus sp. SCS-8]|uniref:hypothetical protein n=1 Tax=Pseudalkalibacillus nanhaiensis TaxID=3115291 RepID=UPI0032DB3343